MVITPYSFYYTLYKEKHTINYLLNYTQIQLKMETPMAAMKTPKRCMDKHPGGTENFNIL